MLLRLGITVAALLLLVAVAIPGWVAVNRTDLSNPNDSDLAIGPVEAELGAAGFEAVKRASALLAKGRDRDAVAAVKDVEVIDLGAAEEGELAELHRTMQRIVELSGESAQAAVEHHRADTAVRHAMVGMRLGRALSRGNGGLTGMMFAAAYQGAALEDLESVVRGVKMTQRRASALVRDLEASRWTSMDWFRTWAVEYQQMKLTLESVDLEAEMRAATGEHDLKNKTYGLLPPEYLWQPNRTLDRSAHVFREQRRRTNRACAPEVSAERRELFPLLTAFGPNALGNILVDVARPSSQMFDAKRCHLETRISLVQTLVAAKSHWDSKGELPKRFTALVPALLPALPMDAFRDAPVQYSVADRRAWSLGSDFKPGPKTAIDPADASEPAISLDFASAR